MTEAQAIALVGVLAEDGYAAQALSTNGGEWSVEVFAPFEAGVNLKINDDILTLLSPNVTGLWHGH